MQVVIVTGLSGAGKSTALRALEDIEFYCVDNLPMPLLAPCVALLASRADRVAVSVDARQHGYLDTYREVVSELRAAGRRVEVLFLEAPDSILLRRYSETRRRHPLSGDDLMEGIRRDRKILAELREGAAVVDTGALNVHQLKGIIQERYGRQEGSLAVTLLSFGFKHGLPAESDLVFDVRFLPNPYFRAELSGSDGTNPQVAEFVLGSDEGKRLLEQVVSLLTFSLPQFEREGKLYLTIAVGCTGGRHRSVYVTRQLAKALGEAGYKVREFHRDVSRGGPGR
jgi:UPF0042 nucleotide-binding protein